MLNFNNIENILNHLKNGKVIILTDDSDRENEADLIFPAEMITPEIVNFMIRNGSGIVCLALSPDHVKKLGLTAMVPAFLNKSKRHTPFTVSIEAHEGITTGVSASDRAHTIQTAMNDHFEPSDIVSPGHVFPLEAKPNGVLQRNGHTEGAVDLMKLAGLKQGAVICELMNPDGSMMRGEKLQKFSQTHQLPILTIQEIINFRLYHENHMTFISRAQLPLAQYGMFEISIFKDQLTGIEHIALFKKHTSRSILTRIHSSCATGDLFTSLRCDCHQQLHYALQKISAQGGLLIYLHQEGRGIGLGNKIKCYELQEQGYDTVEANQLLNLPIDSRNYYAAAGILKHLNIHSVDLLTNNPSKIIDLKKYGIVNINRVPMPAFKNALNEKYLKTKIEKLQHWESGVHL